MSTIPHTTVKTDNWFALAGGEGSKIANAIAKQFSASADDSRFAIASYVYGSEVEFEAMDDNRERDTKRNRFKSFGFYAKVVVFWDDLSCDILMLAFLMVVAYRVPKTGIQFTVNSGQPEFYRSALELAQGVEPGMATPEWMEGYLTGAIKPNARAIEVPAELDFRG